MRTAECNARRWMLCNSNPREQVWDSSSRGTNLLINAWSVASVSVLRHPLSFSQSVWMLDWIRLPMAIWYLYVQKSEPKYHCTNNAWETESVRYWVLALIQTFSFLKYNKIITQTILTNYEVILSARITIQLDSGQCAVVSPWDSKFLMVGKHVQCQWY